MVKALHYHGPDDRGLHFFDYCALGDTRLNIVDLDQGQHPMFNPQGNVGVVFIGEIYGSQQLRAKHKYPFQTKPDTEVILALYQQYGPAFMQHLPGMFALVLWDDSRQTQICARDRLMIGKSISSLSQYELLYGIIQ